MSLRRHHLSVLAILATLAVAGCGGSTGSSKSTSSTAASTPAAPAPTSSSTAAAKPAAGGTQKVEIKNFDYSPRMLTVAAGTKVSWTNADTANHTVTFDDGSQALGNQPKGKTVSFTFKKPGTYKYHCDYHPNMHGTVVVT
jgi:plastocyanin